ncbi:energy transducer TonB [Elizabethkingia meningoseptica]|uniref:energy transducer TonB n=1 Tax=Elizabethkingia meningoseptica TaxID=238 RepID=UPI0008421217|nr:hypothetical protein [Elizabethkingia meningoseptica]MDE5525208.1 hypothetical protein [Elizabethkingia meningoseptica]MEC4710926.1 hypothetical protein [Elizabethkingia meningoseptica]ODM53709.1 hypothetical protein BES09_05730 [Elizabethkingia meningoseptica]OHT28934.1 hypothetical protein BFF93_05735 [Elizabethkingia meningoseptica]OPC10506.1 hypothetical protein BAX93_08570 [Elizabethkingia meningoseptica]
MIKLFSLFCLSVTSLSCINKKVNQYEIDCNYETKLAENDFKYKNYTYSNVGGLGFSYIGTDEFEKLLKENNIKYKYILESCVVNSFEDIKFENCYSTKMNKLLENKYGKSFFDSLKTLSVKEYLLKNKDSIYDEDVLDSHMTKSKTTDYQKQTMAAETNYKKKFVYPSDYIKAKDNGSSYTSTQFLLMKDGTVSDVQAESVFSNSKNNIFEKLFNERAELYVKKFDWKPSTIQGIPVNSHMSMVVFYD